MNLGSPDSTEVKDVRKYLNEFLMDERVIDVNYLLRLFLVRGIISPFRAPKSAEAYKTVWTAKGSPLIVLTRQLQQALQQITPDKVVIAMRYGNPSPKDAYDELVRSNPSIEEVTVVPLYPHFAMSSYETAAEYAKEVYRKGKYPFRLKVINAFYRDEPYLHALSESIRPYLANEFDHLLFSYHGVPERHIYKGDITGQHCLRSAVCCSVESPAHAQCYRHQCLDTTRRVGESLQLPDSKYSYSFQSRLGRDEWLKPYTAARLAELPKQGIKKLLVVCPAFISDCLETLEEIAEQGKETFMHAGGESYTMIPCLNVHPLWVKALDHLVKEGASTLV